MLHNVSENTGGRLDSLERVGKCQKLHRATDDRFFFLAGSILNVEFIVTALFRLGGVL